MPRAKSLTFNALPLARNVLTVVNIPRNPVALSQQAGVCHFATRLRHNNLACGTGVALYWGVTSNPGTSVSKPSLPALRRAVTALGGVVTVSEGRGLTVTCDAPAGCLWSSDGTHALVEATSGPGPASWRAELVAALLDRVAYGVEPCTDPDCDVCHPLPEA